ncbi:hypothetical protein [Paraburkholderia saeva]|uniref:Uncharacterized protein n=1 Tax=Paraburkholderia saeva TaxID=2777537 RepID=A0A9N8RSA1_9BURK|nr:hypothetical protein [Paraburkholderia saeva]CAG4886952.1 hypothetical protein LMG31841_00300 [Paraburkholderia saeva]CAG4887038.1 hypothetical protein R70241_00318 [Paraburkholderia saeva]
MRGYRNAGLVKIYAIVEADATHPMRYLLEKPGPDGSPWTLDPSKARRFGGFEGFDFLGRALERGLELAMLPLDGDVDGGEGQ